MVLFHIFAGLLAITAGAAALFSAKGSPLHRKAGTVFVAAMLVMAGSATYLAAFVHPDRVNTMVGLLTIYLVCTGYLTLRLPTERMRGLLVAFMLSALAVGAFALRLGIEATGSPTDTLNGAPAPMMFVFGTVAIAGGLLDARLLWAGGIRGAQRLIRHLWRMGFAMFIATASLFLGQPEFFPEPLRHTGLRAIPVLVVILIPLYWLVRVSWTAGRRSRSTFKPTPLRGTAQFKRWARANIEEDL